MLYSLIGMVAAVVSFAACPTVARILVQKRIIDHPNSRSLHEHPTPRGGGIAIAFGCVFATVAGREPAVWFLLLSSVAFALVGLADDLRPRSALARLLVQASLSALVLTVLLAQDGLLRAFWPLAPLGIVWIVGFVNAFNFMDGINGISVVQALAGGIYWWVVGIELDQPTLAIGGIAIAGAALGFAPFNVTTGAVFLGDVGSYFIGSWLAVLALVGLKAGVPLLSALAPYLIYLADTATTIARRIIRGDRWVEAHKDHAYQRLVRLGWTHSKVTAFTGALITINCVMGLLIVGETTYILGLLVMVTACVTYLTTPKVGTSSVRLR